MLSSAVLNFKCIKYFQLLYIRRLCSWKITMHCEDKACFTMLCIVNHTFMNQLCFSQVGMDFNFLNASVNTVPLLQILGVEETFGECQFEKHWHREYGYKLLCTCLHVWGFPHAVYSVPDCIIHNSFAQDK